VVRRRRVRRHLVALALPCSARTRVRLGKVRLQYNYNFVTTLVSFREALIQF
jgi:hypothetical protein